MDNKQYNDIAVSASVWNKTSTLEDFDLDCAAIGGLVGKASDFAPLIHSMLNEGGSLLRKDTVIDMLSLKNEGQIGIESKIGAGIGWKIGRTHDGRRFYNHEGGGGGFTTEIRMYPDSDVGFVVMMNTWSLNMAEVKLAHIVCEILHESACHPDSFLHSQLRVCSEAELEK
mmetsp:Transcript_14218/g.16493  ORF Transcript_14218/g.16493 Transcript_14218/m.16493 type:complete len:171 (+) Transcript_14218:157-669(+)